MKAKTVTVSFGRTVNLGNYNSLRFEASVEVELGEGEKSVDAIDAARKIVKQEVEAAILAELKAINESRDAILNSMKGS